jgi:hypothetical protein
MSTQRTTAPRSSAASSQGEMLASWSEAGDDDFVARPQAAGQGAGEREGERGHVLAEDDLVGRGRAQEIGHGGMGFVEDLVRINRCLKCPAMVGVGIQQIIHHARHYRARHLRAPGLSKKTAPDCSAGN